MPSLPETFLFLPVDGSIKWIKDTWQSTRAQGRPWLCYPLAAPVPFRRQKTTISSIAVAVFVLAFTFIHFCNVKTTHSLIRLLVPRDRHHNTPKKSSLIVVVVVVGWKKKEGTLFFPFHFFLTEKEPLCWTQRVRWWCFRFNMDKDERFSDGKGQEGRRRKERAFFRFWRFHPNNSG